LDGGTTKEPHIGIDTGKPTDGYVDFDPWIADGATKENTNGKGAGRRRAYLDVCFVFLSFSSTLLVIVESEPGYREVSEKGRNGVVDNKMTNLFPSQVQFPRGAFKKEIINVKRLEARRLCHWETPRGCRWRRVVDLRRSEERSIWLCDA
jgi:hypothetical protein